MRSCLSITTLLELCLLLAGCGANTSGKLNGNSTPANGNSATGAVNQAGVAALADAVTQGYPQGANLFSWNSLGSRVVAYVIYRDTNPNAPIAVVDGQTTYFVDSATPLPMGDAAEEYAVSITVDTNLGTVTTFTNTPTFLTTLTGETPTETVAAGSYTVNAFYTPLTAGQTCGYQIKAIYLDVTQPGVSDPLGFWQTYQLSAGNKGGDSSRITLIAPPVLFSPANGQLPSTGSFQCQIPTGATTFQLQLSNGDPTFAPADTTTIPAIVESSLVAQATYALTAIYADPKFKFANVIYWRMGARAAGQALPMALQDANQAGWVYSPPSTFILPAAPPGPG